MLTIHNKTITNNHKELRNIFTQSLGLMFAPPLNDMAYVFSFTQEQCQSIHMFFVFQTIDVLYLDKHKTIVDIHENLKPFRFSTSKTKAQYFIECPAGTIKQHNLRTGMQVRWTL